MNITNKAKSLPLPPGKLGLPIIGQNRVFQQNSPNYREYLYQKYGAIAKTRIFGQNYIYLQEYEAIKFVLANEDKYFVNTTFPNSKKIFGETHIGMLTGEKHKERRRLLAQALKNKALSEYIDTINNLSQSYLEKWTQSDAIDLYAEFNNYTLDLFLKLLLGIDFGSETEIDNYLKIMGLGLIGIPLALPWTKFGQALETKQQLFSQIEQIIIKKQKQNDFGSDILGV